MTLHPRAVAGSVAGRRVGGHRVRGGSAGRARGRQRGRDEPASKAFELVRVTNCAGVMIGRGAVQDPLVFRRIRDAFASRVHGTRLSRRTQTTRKRAGGDHAVPARVRGGGVRGEGFPGRARARQQAPQRARPGEVQAGQVEAGVQVLVRGEPGLDAVKLARGFERRRRTSPPTRRWSESRRLVETHWRAPEDVLVDAFSMRAGCTRGMRDGGRRRSRDSAVKRRRYFYVLRK